MFSPCWNLPLCCLRAAALFIAARQVGVLGAAAFRYNVLFIPSAVLLVWLLAVGKGFISRLLSAKPFLWLAGLSPYGFLIHQVLIRYMEWFADKFNLTVHPVVWTLTVLLLTLCLSSFYKALECRVRQRHAKAAHLTNKMQGRCALFCAAALFGSDGLFFTSQPLFWR